MQIQHTNTRYRTQDTEDKYKQIHQLLSSLISHSKARLSGVGFKTALKYKSKYSHVQIQKHKDTNLKISTN